MPSSSREGGRLCARDPDRNASRTEEKPLSSSEIKKPVSGKATSQDLSGRWFIRYPVSILHYRVLPVYH
jgi:hypothetical protein